MDWDCYRKFSWLVYLTEHKHFRVKDFFYSPQYFLFPLQYTQVSMYYIYFDCLIIFLSLVCVWGMKTTVHIWRSEDNCGSQFVPSTMWLLMIELKSSGLADWFFFCCAISMSLFFFLVKEGRNAEKWPKQNRI